MWRVWVGAWLAMGCAAVDSPVAVVTADVVDGDWPLTVNLSAEGSTGRDLVDWRWDLGDGEGASGVHVTHTYWGKDDYLVQLTVEEGSGLTAVDQLTVSVGRPGCPAAGEPRQEGEVESAELWETSGVAESLNEPGILYVHNDAGNATRLFAIDAGGLTLAEWSLADVSWGDWEDIAVSKDPDTGTSYIYFGNIGDNDADKDQISVWRIAEPDIEAGDEEVTGSEIVLQYPDSPHDSETLFVDPVTDDIYVVQKDYGGMANVFRKPAPHREGAIETLEWVFELDFSVAPLSGNATTAGDVSPDGTWIIIRTYGRNAYLWRRDRTRPMWEAFETAPCEMGLPSEPQGESIAFSSDGQGLWTVSEGVHPAVNYTPVEGP